MNKDGVNELQANTWNRLNDSTLIEIQRSLIELYTKDDMTRKDVEHLINYLFFYQRIGELNGIFKKRNHYNIMA